MNFTFVFYSFSTRGGAFQATHDSVYSVTIFGPWSWQYHHTWYFRFLMYLLPICDLSEILIKRKMPMILHLFQIFVPSTNILKCTRNQGQCFWYCSNLFMSTVMSLDYGGRRRRGKYDKNCQLRKRRRPYFLTKQQSPFQMWNCGVYSVFLNASCAQCVLK